VRSDPGLEGFVQLASAFACVGVSIGAIATISAPAAAVSFSVDAVSLHQALRVELGGGLIHGSECSTYDGFGACHDEFDRNGAFSPHVPVYGEGAVSVSTTVGANTVGADAWGGTTLEYSSDSARWGAGTFPRRADDRECQPARIRSRSVFTRGQAPRLRSTIGSTSRCRATNVSSFTWRPERAIRD
jgi:hypothetical protein